MAQARPPVGRNNRAENARNRRRTTTSAERRRQRRAARSIRQRINGKAKRRREVWAESATPDRPSPKRPTIAQRRNEVAQLTDELDAEHGEMRKLRGEALGRRYTDRAEVVEAVRVIRALRGEEAT